VKLDLLRDKAGIVVPFAKTLQLKFCGTTLSSFTRGRAAQLFPTAIPHSIQGLKPDAAEFLLVFDDGNFSECETILLLPTSPT
jgi:hypothetical protein